MRAGYEWPRQDRPDFIPGISGEKLIVLLGLGLGALTCRLAGVSMLVALVWPAITGPLLLARVKGRVMYQWVLPVLKWVRVRRAPMWWTDKAWDGSCDDLAPVWLGGVRIKDVAIEDDRFAVVLDSMTRTATILWRCSGSAMDLVSETKQYGRVDQFCSSLAQIAGLDGVKRICWTERTYAQRLLEYAEEVSRRVGFVANAPLRRHYVELVSEVGDRTVRHETFVAVAVALKGSMFDKGANTADRIASRLDRTGKHVERALRGAGVAVSPRLTTEEVAKVLRESYNPRLAQGVGAAEGRLETRIGADQRCGPTSSNTRWASLQTDGAWHKTYQFSWPRLPVHALWMPRFLESETQARTTTFIMRPVDMGSAHREIGRELAKHDSTQLMASWMKRRPGYVASRKAADVEKREREMYGGARDLAVTAFVTVSAFDEPTLKENSAAFESNASAVALGVSPCHGEHDAAFAAALPLGLGHKHGAF